MSQEEQDFILGRLTRESRESDREVAAIETELKRRSESYSAVSLKINGLLRQPPLTTMEDASEALLALTPADQMIERLRNLQAAKDRSADLKLQLERLS